MSKGLQKLIPAKFRDKYPECADRRTCRRVEPVSEGQEVLNAVVPLCTLGSLERSFGTRFLRPQVLKTSKPSKTRTQVSTIRYGDLLVAEEEEPLYICSRLKGILKTCVYYLSHVHLLCSLYYGAAT